MSLRCCSDCVMRRHRRCRLKWRRTSLTITLLLLMTSFPVSDGRAASGSDARTVTYRELIRDPSTRVFAGAGLVDFQQILVDSQLKQIYVGVRDNLLRLRLHDLRPLEINRWTSDNNTVTLCIAKGQKPDECHNFIRVLLLRGETLFTCGTNAYSPQCTWRKRSNIGQVISRVPGIAKCPFSPRQNNTFLLASDGSYYTATVMDFTGRDAAIYRSMGQHRHLRTVQYNSRWLNDPDFVSSYEIGQYIYFFFRETATEYINCGKVVYSRVARVCKSDSGGRVLLEDNWTTFVKARLNCSLPGDFPFYYNELQSTFYVESQQLFYAVFTTAPTSIYGSAVCVYNLTAFDEVFNGAFKYQDNAQSAWTRVPNVSPIKCGPSEQPATSRRSSRVSVGTQSAINSSSPQRHLIDIQKFQMVDAAVQPVHHRPPVVVDKQRFYHIVADKVEVTYHAVRQTVVTLFLTTLEGVVYKFVLVPNLPSSPASSGSATSCLVERIYVTPEDNNQQQQQQQQQQQTVRTVQFVPSHRSLLVGTTNRLYMLAVHRCGKYLSQEHCLRHNDPYCGWDDKRQKCAAIGHPALSCSNRRRDIIKVDGGWSEWSNWQHCTSPTPGGATTEQCWCRTRSCDQPRPSFGGTLCVGQSIQVTNCTVDGEPLISAVTVDWSSWSEWTTCSAHCGDGHQVRQRTCIANSSVQAPVTSEPCSGRQREKRVCRLADCKEVSKASEWSPWQRATVADSNSLYREDSVQCVCHAEVERSYLLHRPRLRVKSRYCTELESLGGKQQTVCSSSSSKDRLHTAFDNTSSTVKPPTPAIPASSTQVTQSNEHQTPCPNECLTNHPSDKKPPDTGKNRRQYKLENSIVERLSSSARGLSSSREFRDPARLLSPEPPSSGDVFAGFCGCRDLGQLRVCQRCVGTTPSTSTAP